MHVVPKARNPRPRLAALQRQRGEDLEVARMSLAGQWLSSYAGTNSGTLVIDIEDKGEYYHGLACAWDSNAKLPSSLVRFVTESKEPTQTLRGVPIFPITVGRVFTPQDVQNAKQVGIVFPTKAEINLSLQSG